MTLMLAPVAASAAVIATVAASLAISGGPMAPRSTSGPVASSHMRFGCRQPSPVHVPPYYLSITGAIKSTATGARLGKVRPPKPFNTIEAITGAADDRTFVVAAQTGRSEGSGIARLFIAKFNPAHRTVTLRALRIPEIPAASLLTGLALAPNGRSLATAVLAGKSRDESVLTVYSLTRRAAKVWKSAGTIGSSPYDSAAVSWSCTGTLAINWFTGKAAGSGVRLLNTSTAGGNLLARSRLVLRLTGSTATGFGFAWDGVLTPNGRRIVAPMVKPLPSQPGQARSADEFEEFSARTGKPILFLYRESGLNPSVDQALEWTNTSGSVLVVAALPRGAKNPVIGVLRGDRFRPIPGAPAATGSEVVIVF